MCAEGLFTGSFTKFKSVFGFEPLTLLVHQGDQCHRSTTYKGRQLRKIVKRHFAWGIKNSQRV